MRVHLSHAQAERLLDGGAVGVPELERLIAAASAPAASVPDPGPALASFRFANANPAARPRRLTAMKSALAAALTTKVIAGAAIAVAATGGLALAASVGALNGTDHPSPNSHANAHATSHPTESASASASASPSPNLRGLCTAFQAGATSNPGKAINSPAFQALVTAAGGTQNVQAFCTKLLGTPRPHHATGKPTALPTQASGHPTHAPSNPPTGHPSGKPTSLPTPGGGRPTGAAGNSAGRP